MISKAEYLYAKKKAGDLKLKLATYETKSKVYAMWKKWLSMSSQEKQALLDKWEAYYEACRKGYYGNRFWQARMHFTNWIKTGNPEEKAKLQAIVQEVKESDVPFIKPPSTIDPRELEHKMQKYFEVIKKQQEYQTLFDEYEDVYEPVQTKKNKTL